METLTNIIKQHICAINFLNAITCGKLKIVKSIHKRQFPDLEFSELKEVMVTATVNNKFKTLTYIYIYS